MLDSGESSPVQRINTLEQLPPIISVLLSCRGTKSCHAKMIEDGPSFISSLAKWQQKSVMRKNEEEALIKEEHKKLKSNINKLYGEM